jgi:diguanylate cyclase (GGDEF)-like protein
MNTTSQPMPKILCVDDDSTVLAATARLLRDDFEVIKATSAEDALKHIDLHPDVAIVLTDQKMGGMTGMDLLTKVQDKAPDAARVIFTGQIELGVMAEAVNTSRIHRFILKPWENDYLRLQMAEALSIHRGLKERRLLQSLSVTDALTQVRNRRYFQDQISVESERALRHGRTLTLVMADIDHFKNINDEFGHFVGDTVLKAVAQHLQHQVRSIDTIARYGGEEFALILPDTPFENAMKVAERIRESIANMEIKNPEGPDLHLTISMGVASLPDHARTANDLISNADAALYQAKRQGRNQTVGALAPK